MADKIQWRRDTAANWTLINPVLAQGEVGLETDVYPPKTKIGDGVTAWNSLAYGEAVAAISLSVAGNNNVALTAVQASAGIVTLTGALTGNINVVVPTVSRSWMVVNSTTGAYSITVKTAAGTGIVVPQGYGLELLCDGVNVLDTESAKAGVASPNVFKFTQTIPNTKTARIALGAIVAGGTALLDVDASASYAATFVAGAASVALSNPPAAGYETTVNLWMTNGGLVTAWTWPAGAVWAKGDGTYVTFSSLGVTFQSAGINLVQFVLDGTNIIGKVIA